MENISNQLSRLSKFDIVDSDGTSIIFSFIKAVVLIVVLLVLCYWIDMLFLTKSKSTEDFDTSNINEEHDIQTEAEAYSTSETLNSQRINDVSTNLVNQEISNIVQVPVNPSIVSTDSIVQEQTGSTLQDKQLENLACEWKMDQTKQSYKKGEHVYVPSSLDGKLGYIGRDFICYRHSIKNQDYVSKRGGCIACTVDLTKNGTNKDFTGTNILSTCVYGSDEDALLDNTIWSHKKCEVMCEKMKDKID